MAVEELPWHSPQVRVHPPSRQAEYRPHDVVAPRPSQSMLERMDHERGAQGRARPRRPRRRGRRGRLRLRHRPPPTVRPASTTSATPRVRDLRRLFQAGSCRRTLSPPTRAPTASTTPRPAGLQEGPRNGTNVAVRRRARWPARHGQGRGVSTRPDTARRRLRAWRPPDLAEVRASSPASATRSALTCSMTSTGRPPGGGRRRTARRSDVAGRQVPRVRRRAAGGRGGWPAGRTHDLAEAASRTDGGGRPRPAGRRQHARRAGPWRRSCPSCARPGGWPGAGWVPSTGSPTATAPPGRSRSPRCSARRSWRGGHGAAVLSVRLAGAGPLGRPARRLANGWRSSPAAPRAGRRPPRPLIAGTPERRYALPQRPSPAAHSRRQPITNIQPYAPTASPRRASRSTRHGRRPSSAPPADANGQAAGTPGVSAPTATSSGWLRHARCTGEPGCWRAAAIAVPPSGPPPGW